MHACVMLHVVYINAVLVAPCFKKSFYKIRSWVPSPQMPYFKQSG